LQNKGISPDFTTYCLNFLQLRKKKLIIGVRIQADAELSENCKFGIIVVIAFK